MTLLKFIKLSIDITLIIVYDKDKLRESEVNSMKIYTKQLKIEERLDTIVLNQYNNNKNSNRTLEQIKQSVNDKCDYFANKWHNLLEISTTQAQINTCNRMLNLIEKKRNNNGRC